MTPPLKDWEKRVDETWGKGKLVTAINGDMTTSLEIIPSKESVKDLISQLLEEAKGGENKRHRRSCR